MLQKFLNKDLVRCKNRMQLCAINIIIYDKDNQLYWPQNLYIVQWMQNVFSAFATHPN